jgi:hypothetical protein
MLTQRIGAKAPAGIDILENIPSHPVLQERQLNSCTDRSPVAMHPFQVERYPMVAILPRIEEQKALVGISRECAAHLDVNVFVPVIVEIGK